MTNVQGAFTETRRFVRGYKRGKNAKLTFRIPIYTNMPENACNKPRAQGNLVCPVEHQPVVLETADLHRGGIVPFIRLALVQVRLVHSIPHGQNDEVLGGIDLERIGGDGVQTVIDPGRACRQGCRNEFLY